MRIKDLRESIGMQQKELALELGIPSNTLSQYENEKREPSIELLKKVAKYFNVSTDYIVGNVDSVFCKDCGFNYDPLDEFEREKHKKYHKAWEEAVCKYGFCWSYIKSDEAELMAKRYLSSDILSKEAKVIYAEDILKAHFSNELRRHGFKYPYSFAHFASVELARQVIKDMMPPEIYDLLIDKYGISEEETLNATTVAAHFDGSEYTEEELNKIREFAAFVKSTRK